MTAALQRRCLNYSWIGRSVFDIFRGTFEIALTLLRPQKGSEFRLSCRAEFVRNGCYSMTSQKNFNDFVRDYNQDYILLLTRASRRHYDCLISSFLVLKDLYNVIQVMYDSGTYTYDVLPYPFSFRADEALLRQLGFDDEQIQNIFGFLDYVQKTQGMDFEACLELGTVAMCAKMY